MVKGNFRNRYVLVVECYCDRDFARRILSIPEDKLIKGSSMGNVRNRLVKLSGSENYDCVIGLIDETSNRGYSSASVIAKWGWRLKKDYGDFSIYQNGKAYIVFLKHTLEEFIHLFLKDIDPGKVRNACKRKGASVERFESRLMECSRVKKLKEVVMDISGKC